MGAVGAAVLIAVNAGIIPKVQDAKKLIPATNTYIPNNENKAVYDKNYEVFKKLYKANKDNFEALNAVK